MLYERVMEQIKTIPYESLLDVENYIQFVISKNMQTSKKKNDLSAFYGRLNFRQDGLSLQKEFRSEWN